MVCLRLSVVLFFVLSLSGSALADVRWYGIGDWGDWIFSYQHLVADSMATYAEDFEPEFIVTLGDNFYQSGIHSVEDEKIDEVWRDTYNHTTLKDLHWYISVGNHDYGLDIGEEWVQVNLTNFEPRWHLPYLWHTFTMTDGETSVQFIMIDTQALREELNNYTTMMEWLDDELTVASADWVIVGAHHPIFSCGDKGPVSGTFYNELLPVLDKHRDIIDVYLTGHDHNLQHLQCIAEPSYFDFIVSGAGGALIYEEDPTCDDVLGAPQYGIDKTFMQVTWGFAAFTATPDYLDVQFVDYNMTTIYAHTRTKAQADIPAGSCIYPGP